MKKTIAWILLIILGISLTGCISVKYTDTAENEAIKKYSIAEKSKSEDEKFEMTLTRAEIVDAVCLDKNSENLFMPITIEEAQKNPSYALIGSQGYVVVSYSLEYKFIGKEQWYDLNTLCIPTLIYDGEYEFSDKYFSIVANKANHMWLGSSSDCYKNGLDSLPGLKDLMFVPAQYTYEPLSEIEYEVRGFIIVPEKIANEDKSLSIIFENLGQEYKIR